MMTMLSNDRSVFAFLTVTAVPQVHLSHPSDLVDFLLSFRIFSPSPSLGNSATAIQHHSTRLTLALTPVPHFSKNIAVCYSNWAIRKQLA